MALVTKCARCDAVALAHCKSKGCGWVVCPTHKIIALTAEQRRKVAGDDA